jgi:hypothetical protein
MYAGASVLLVRLLSFPTSLNLIFNNQDQYGQNLRYLDEAIFVPICFFLKCRKTSIINKIIGELF